MKVTWIASFPKSGSTWLRFIVAQLFFGERDEMPNVRDAIPDIHDYRETPRYSWGGVYPMKTHLPFHNLPPRLLTQSAIYIVRNPLDMVDSALAYLNPVGEADRKYVIDCFCQYGSVEPWFSLLHYGSWEENVKSWFSGEHLTFPHLFIRYEDMLDNPHDGVRRIANFYDLDTSDTRITEIVEATSFGAMKKAEEKELAMGTGGFFTDEQDFGKESFRFMRSGKAGGYMKNLREEEIALLVARFRPVMEEHGYL